MPEPPDASPDDSSGGNEAQSQAPETKGPDNAAETASRSNGEQVPKKLPDVEMQGSDESSGETSPNDQHGSYDAQAPVDYASTNYPGSDSESPGDESKKHYSLSGSEFFEDESNYDYVDRTSYRPPLTPAPMVELTRPHPAHIQIDVIVADEDRFRWLDLDDPERRCHPVPDMPPALYRSLTLPTGWHRFGSCRQLFDDILVFLKNHTLLSDDEARILTYWSIATWFPDFLSFLPSAVITGTAAVAEPVFRALAAICRRPVLLAGIDPGVLRAPWLGKLMPTLLIRAPQLNKRMGTLLDASTRPGYLMATGKDMQPFYCPKCIYLGDPVDRSLIPSSIQIHVSSKSRRLAYPSPTSEVIETFQNKLLLYRFLGRENVAASKFRVHGFRPEVCAIAESLGAIIVDDLLLQHDIIDLLRERDEQSGVDRASGRNGIVVRAVLSLCHEPDLQQAYVRDIASAANRIYVEEGESLKMSSETAGHILRSLGLYSRRLGSAGRGLVLDKSIRSHAHRLGHAYEVLPPEPACGHCHELQGTLSEELM
ncbi:MAG TPA: hypothetical protein VNZ03_09440 [Terriglobales bacterium]|nr:hypothetical protein [Terriglobales bacterium]